MSRGSKKKAKITKEKPAYQFSWHNVYEIARYADDARAALAQNLSEAETIGELEFLQIFEGMMNCESGSNVSKMLTQAFADHPDVREKIRTRVWKDDTVEYFLRNAIRHDCTIDDYLRMEWLQNSGPLSKILDTFVFYLQSAHCVRIAKTLIKEIKFPLRVSSSRSVQEKWIEPLLDLAETHRLVVQWLPQEPQEINVRTHVWPVFANELSSGVARGTAAAFFALTALICSWNSARIAGVMLAKHTYLHGRYVAFIDRYAQLFKKFTEHRTTVLLGLEGIQKELSKMSISSGEIDKWGAMPMQGSCVFNLKKAAQSYELRARSVRNYDTPIETNYVRTRDILLHTGWDFVVILQQISFFLTGRLESFPIAILVKLLLLVDHPYIALLKQDESDRECMDLAPGTSIESKLTHLVTAASKRCVAVYSKRKTPIMMPLIQRYSVMPIQTKKTLVKRRVVDSDNREKRVRQMEPMDEDE